MTAADTAIVVPSQVEEPIRAELFGIERLEQHAESLAAAANVFVGMTEAPLLIKPYLLRLSRSELFALMTCGMATIAGTVMVLYASIIGNLIPDAMGHILIASL